MEEPSGVARVLAEARLGSEAMARARHEDAIWHYERAVQALTPEADSLAPDLYENLAIARMHSHRLHAAVRAFFRAIDGAPERREQSLRLSVSCLFQLGQRQDARRLLHRYENAFGAYPITGLREQLWES